MQRKIAPPAPFAERLHRWGLRRGFPALLAIAPRWPRWLLFLGARVIIWTVMFVHPAPKREIAANLARLLDLPAGSRRLRRATRQMLFNFAYYWVDMFRFSQLPAERARDLLDGCIGAEHLESAHARGKGVILLTAHLGNWEMGGLFLGQLDLPLSVVYVRDQFEVAERFRSLLRQRVEVEEIAIDPAGGLASLPVLRALSEGRVVAMQGDRDFNDRGVLVDFCGAPAAFPLGPFHLARMTGASLLPVFVVYGSGHRFEIEIGEPIHVPKSRDREGEARRALESWV
ncbi:MAG TPA: lysophospholipid acyltransferase family protein, partial [Thermoanaerobaculia bacterium]|nr:lysophospholipid acyltransferase family protein [Thermoanaerobaculia bacterium]